MDLEGLAKRYSAMPDLDLAGEAAKLTSLVRDGQVQSFNVVEVLEQLLVAKKILFTRPYGEQGEINRRRAEKVNAAIASGLNGLVAYCSDEADLWRKVEGAETFVQNWVRAASFVTENMPVKQKRFGNR